MLSRIASFVSARLAAGRRRAVCVTACGIAAGLVTAGVLVTSVAHAQNRASPPLPSLPETVFSADYSIRVEQLAGGLQNPWSMKFLPDGDILITERSGRLRIIRDGVLDPEPIAGVPEVRRTVLGGLLDVVLHPDFEDNRILYLSYSKTIDDDFSTTAVARGRFDGSSLSSVEDIFIANTRSQSLTNFGGRMVFGQDGKLYLTVGERQEQERAQDPMDHGGKVLRLNDDGTAPDDNPFVNDPAFQPEIYTLGHRSPQGLAVHPETGEIWENEHGPLGGDEINVLQPGANYGWPLVSFGIDYTGLQITETGQTELAGYQAPLVYWVPSIAISGMSFYEGEPFSAWAGNALVGALMRGRVRGSGHFQRLTFENGKAITREPILLELRQRIRDVLPGPDGLIYVLTEENPGALLRLAPE
jgi:glucose/arabinose dehydrogenase